MNGTPPLDIQVSEGERAYVVRMDDTGGPFNNPSARWWLGNGPWECRGASGQSLDRLGKAAFTSVVDGEVDADAQTVITRHAIQIAKERAALATLWGAEHTWTDAVPADAPARRQLRTPPGLSWHDFGLRNGRYGDGLFLGDFLVRPHALVLSQAPIPENTATGRIAGMILEREGSDLARYSRPRRDVEQRIRLTRGFVLAHLLALPAMHLAGVIAGDVRLANALLSRDSSNWPQDSALPLIRLVDFSHATLINDRTDDGRPTEGMRFLARANHGEQDLRGPSDDYFALAVSAHQLLHDGLLPFTYNQRNVCQAQSGEHEQFESDVYYVNAKRHIAQEIHKQDPAHPLWEVRVHDLAGAEDLTELIQKLVVIPPSQLESAVLDVTRTSAAAERIVDAARLAAAPREVDEPTSAERIPLWTATTLDGEPETATSRIPAAAHTAPDAGFGAPRSNWARSVIRSRLQDTTREHLAQGLTLVRQSPFLLDALGPVAVAIVAWLGCVAWFDWWPTAGPSFWHPAGGLSGLALAAALGLMNVLRRSSGWRRWVNALLSSLVVALWVAVPPAAWFATEALSRAAFWPAAWQSTSWDPLQTAFAAALAVGVIVTAFLALPRVIAACGALGVRAGVLIALTVLATGVASLIIGAKFNADVAHATLPVDSVESLGCVDPYQFLIPTDRVCVAATPGWTPAALPSPDEFDRLGKPYTNAIALTASGQECLTAQVDYESVGIPVRVSPMTAPTRAVLGTQLGYQVGDSAPVVQRSTTSNPWGWHPRLKAGRAWQYAESDGYATDSGPGSLARVTYYWTQAGDPTRLSSTLVRVMTVENRCTTDSSAKSSRKALVLTLLASVQARTSKCVDTAAFQAAEGSSLANVTAAVAVCLPALSKLQPVGITGSDGAIKHTASDGDWYLTLSAAMSGRVCPGEKVDNGYTRFEKDGQVYYCGMFTAHGKTAALFLSHGVDNGTDMAADDALIAQLRTTISHRS